MSEPEGRWMKVEFYGLLPRRASLFPGEYLDATGRLAELFGFTGLAHLTVWDEAAAGERTVTGLPRAGQSSPPSHHPNGQAGQEHKHT